MGAKCPAADLTSVFKSVIVPVLYVCPLLYSACLLLYFASSFSSLLLFCHNTSFTSLPVDRAQGQIIIISKPFARSLPANPMFGLMSHAPH